MRISDWSSDVCSSDLPDGRQRRWRALFPLGPVARLLGRYGRKQQRCPARPRDRRLADGRRGTAWRTCRARHRRGRQQDGSGRDRKSVVWGKSVSVRVNLGGRRIIKKKKEIKTSKK